MSQAVTPRDRMKVQESYWHMPETTPFHLVQVLANIESAQQQNRLYDALKQGNTALAALQQVSSLLVPAAKYNALISTHEQSAQCRSYSCHVVGARTPFACSATF